MITCLLFNFWLNWRFSILSMMDQVQEAVLSQEKGENKKEHVPMQWDLCAITARGTAVLQVDYCKFPNTKMDQFQPYTLFRISTD